MKLLYISQDKYPAYRADVAILFGKELPKLGLQVDWILQSKEKLDKGVIKEDNGSITYVGPTNSGDSLWSKISKHWMALKTDLQILTFARKNKYDFIQVKDKFITAFIGLAAAKLYGAKFIYWMSFPIAESYLYMYHENTARFPILYFLRGALSKFLLYKIIMPFSQHVFVQSEKMKLDVIDQGINADKLTPVPMGVDIESIPYAGVTDDQLVESKQNKILYLGTLDRNRHIEFLLEVMAVVVKNKPDAVLYLVGKGEHPGDEEFILDEINKYSLQKSVVMTGFLPMEDAWEYVKNADVCVSPFYPTPILNSTSPTKLVEYMAMAKPVVANDHPEQKLVIEQSGAGICVSYKVNDFAEAIETLLVDQILCEQMGVKGRKYAEAHRNYPVIANEVFNKYNEII